MSAIALDVRNWYRDDAGGVQIVRDAKLQPFRVWVWLGSSTLIPSTAMEFVLNLSDWGLVEIPLTNKLYGTISVGIEMIRDPGDSTTVSLGTCKSRVLTPGMEWWCSGSGTGRTCTDMALGGASPQPGYVGYPLGAWTFGSGPSHPEGGEYVYLAPPEPSDDDEEIRGAWAP
jgi:hypothetical protein